MDIANITTGWISGEYAVVRAQRNAADAADTEAGLGKLLMVKLEWTASSGERLITLNEMN